MLDLYKQLGRGLACGLMLLLLVSGFAPAAFAQSQATSGQVAGAIKDQQGAAVAGAKVTATSEDTGVTRSASTNSDGLYSIVQLPPGIYKVSVEASGFQTTNVTDVSVVVGRTITIDLNLGIGSVTEEVTVTAGDVGIQTTRSERDAVLNDVAIKTLPINGRRFQDFVTLTPTAQVEPTRQQISLAGQRGINGNISVDGADYNNPFFGGLKGGERSNFAFSIPQESIREFQVVASGYSAEFGRSTGGIVNAVTKSGTNDFHGSAFYLLRHKEFAASSEFFDTINEGDPTTFKDDQKFTFVPTQQQWGGSVGGPIVEDKLFFFGAYEQQRVRLPRAVVIAQLASVQPTADIAEALAFYRSQEQPFQSTNDAIALLGRVDWNINEDNRANFRYNYSNNTGENSTNTGSAVLPITNRAVSNDGTEKDNNNTVTGQWTWIVNDKTVNEFRGQFSREKRPREANSTVAQIQTNFAFVGNRNFLPNVQNDRRFQLADNITFSAGNHTIKGGVEWNRVLADQTFGFNQFGSYDVRFSSDNLAVLENLQVGGPNPNRFDRSNVRYTQQIGNLEAKIDTDELAFFIQDSWRALPNLTFNLGVRWEGQWNPTPDSNNADLVEKVRGFTFPLGSAIDPTFIPDMTDQWQPRAGFAWDPWSDGKTVVRGYGGIYYARTPALIYAGPINNFRLPPGDVSITLPFAVSSGQAATLYDQLALIGIDLNSFSLDALPTITPAQAAQIAAALGISPDPFLGANVLAIASDFENPRSVQAGAGFERQILDGWVAGADFAYVNTVHLTRNRQYNLPDANRLDPISGRPIYLETGVLRPIPTLRDVTVRESSARSLYRALTISSKFQRSWGQLSAFYTLSTNYSDDDSERDAGAVFYDDAYDFAPEYNYSIIDRRHQFTMNGVFFLPWDVEVSGAVRTFSGAPFDARIGSDVNRDNFFNDRPYAAKGVPFIRNGFRNFATAFADVRVQKKFNLTEQQSLTFSLEFFNLPNASNITLAQGFATIANFCSIPAGQTAIPADCGFSGPTNRNFMALREQNTTSRQFGRLLTGNNPGSPFQMQVGLRYQF